MSHSKQTVRAHAGFASEGVPHLSAVSHSFTVTETAFWIGFTTGSDAALCLISLAKLNRVPALVNRFPFRQPALLHLFAILNPWASKTG
jgi:hypothetical protein